MALAATVAFALFWNARRLAAANGWVNHTLEVEAHLYGLVASLGDLESGARGYVITSDQSFRRQADQAAAGLETGAQRLAALVGDNPRQLEAREALQTVLQRKLAGYYRITAAKDAHAAPDELTRLLLQGKSAGDEVRARLGRMIAAERELLGDRTAQAAEVRRRTQGIALGLGCALLVALALFGTSLRADVARRRREAAAVRESEERFRLLLGSLDEHAVIMLGADGRVMMVNHAAERLFGYEARELIGQPLTRFYPDTPEREVRAGRELVVAADKGRYDDEGPRVRKDGSTFTAEVVVTAVRGPEGDLRGYAKIVRDVTARREMEEQLRVATEKLAASNRELQDFAMVASHDLQEPLRKIQMFGDKFQRKFGPALGEEGQDYLRRMMSAAARGQSLIQGLLAFSRVTTKAQPPSPVDLGTTAREVVSDLEARLADVSGRVEIGSLPVIDADPLQMRQLLQNLIGNALKFRRPEAPPLVQVRSEPLEADEGARRKWRLLVQDNGIGFEQKYVDRIFKLFQRLHERSAYEGSGMGLAICRKIVERHGGNITARSAPGEGTTFLIDLPAHQEIREGA